MTKLPAIHRKNESPLHRQTTRPSSGTRSREEDGAFSLPSIHPTKNVKQKSLEIPAIENRTFTKKEQIQWRKQQLFNRSARKIQSIYRGFIVKKRRADEQALTHRRHAFDVMDQLLTEYIAEDILPEILIEVFTSEGDEYAPEPFENQMTYAIYCQVCTETIAESLREVIPNAIQQLIDQHLKQKYDAHGKNPLVTLVNNLLHDWLRHILRELILEVISDMVSEFLLVQEHDQFILASIQPMLRAIVHEVLDDRNLDWYAETLIEELVRTECQALVCEIQHQDLQLNERTQDQLEFQAVASAAETMLDHLVFENLLSLLVQKGDRILFKVTTEDLVNELISRRLIQLMQETTTQASNYVLDDVYQQWIDRAGFQVLARQLARQLNQIEQDVHHEEQQLTGLGSNLF